MRRISHLLGFVILAGLLAGVSAAQDDSLAEAARQHRKQKEAKPVAVRQVFTNDNLPAEGTISTVGAPKSEEGQDATQNAEGTANGEQAAAAPDEKKSVDGKPAGAKPGDDPKQRQNHQYGLQSRGPMLIDRAERSVQLNYPPWVRAQKPLLRPSTHDRV